MAGPRILVFGRTGQLAQSLAAAPWPAAATVTALGREEADLAQPASLGAVVAAHAPDLVVIAAAHTAVDKAETEEALATLINGEAPGVIADAAARRGAPVIHVSTDYVFDGNIPVPYTEYDTPSPASAYGRSKLAGEKAALTWPGTMIIRTSWLYSSYGNNFVKTILRKAGSSHDISVVFDQVGSPTYAADLANAIMEIISGVIRNKHNFVPGIFNYSNEGVCSWYDLAIEIIREAGSQCSVIPVRSSAWPSKVKRPAYSVLDKTRIKESFNLTIPHWRTSLNNCISKINRI